MRPIARQVNATRYPLDEILGAPADMRLLRVLAEFVAGPVSSSDAARLSGLTPAGARRALERLARTSLVRRVGGRRSPLFELREEEPLTSGVRELFRCESERYRSFLDRLKALFTEFSEVRRAWIDSPPSGAGEPLHIGILSDSRSLTYLGEQIRKRIGEIESDYDVVAEIHAFSDADVPEVDWDNVELLAGYSRPEPASAGSGVLDRDDRAVLLDAAVVKLIDEDPGLIRRAARHVERLLQAEQGPAAHDLREWLDILSDYSPQRVRDFIVSDTPRAQRLRRSSPFLAVLSSDERGRLIDSLESSA